MTATAEDSPNARSTSPARARAVAGAGAVAVAGYHLPTERDSCAALP